jgi:hypothetical protein
MKSLGNADAPPNNSGSYYYQTTATPWSDSSGNNAYQEAYTPEGRKFLRTAVIGASSWENWKEYLFLKTGTQTSTRINTDYGYIDIGPMNTSFCHFNTDRPGYYFDKYMTVNDRVEIYNSNTYLAETEGKIAGNTIFHQGNMGSGSGLDADTLDGIDSTGFSLSTHTHSELHTHSNKANLDTVNQDLNTSDDVQFNSVRIGNIKIEYNSTTQSLEFNNVS